MQADMQLVFFHRGPVARFGSLDFAMQPRQPLDGVQRQLVAVEVVQHHHVEGRGGGAFFLEAAHMDVGVVVAAVGEPVHQRRVAVEREDHRFVVVNSASKSRSSRPCGCSVCGCSAIRSTTLTTRMRMSGT
jgi:hypothetical protein